MSLSIRNSRSIIVDDVEYRWSPSQDSGFMVLVVQVESGIGSKLEVIISDSENILVENGRHTIEIGGSKKLMIKPNLVEKLIRDSIALGWSPTTKGKPVELSLKEMRLVVSRGI